MDKLLRRKVDSYLMAWKNNPDRKPLIIKGARQIGKTRSVEWFGSQNYNSVGYKEDYEMHSMDFEEFIWAKGYSEDFIDELYSHMLEVKPTMVQLHH